MQREFHTPRYAGHPATFSRLPRRQGLSAPKLRQALQSQIAALAAELAVPPEQVRAVLARVTRCTRCKRAACILADA